MNISRRAWMDTGPLNRAQYEEKFLEPVMEQHYHTGDGAGNLMTSFRMVPYFSYCRLWHDGQVGIIRKGERVQVHWNHPWTTLAPDYFNNQFALCA